MATTQYVYHLLARSQYHGDVADGDVRLDAEYQFPDGTRVVLFAVENAEYPGGVNYRFAYLDVGFARTLLRYDNSRVPPPRGGRPPPPPGDGRHSGPVRRLRIPRRPVLEGGERGSCRTRITTATSTKLV